MDATDVVNETDANASGSYFSCKYSNRSLWWSNIALSVILYIVGFSFFCCLFCLRKGVGIGCIKLTKYYRETKKLCRRIGAGDTAFSRIAIVVVLICNVTYVATAVYRTYLPVHRCFEQTGIPPELIIEAIISAPLIAYFVVRLLASDNIILFWFNIYTIIDIFTLPHVYLEFVLGEDWLGLKSLRFIWLIQVIDVVKFIPFIKSLNVVDIFALLIRILTLWLTATGLIHTLEASGDPWNTSNAQSTSFPEYAYLIMVTLSTVGYGDLSPKTALGKTFITFFIVGGLAYFAAALPVLVEVTQSFYEQRRFAKFDTTKVSKHIIVCGHITGSSMANFLKDFLHPDRGDKTTHVLFVSSNIPDLRVKTVLREYRSRVQYYKGSVLNSKVLAKAKLNAASACVILANKHCTNPQEEDSANLFRLVAFKNSFDSKCSSIPVIIQVLACNSKDRAVKILGWNPDRDIVICLNELKLGMLAQSILCPGFSTLIANLFYTTGDVKLTQHSPQWQHLYSDGASKELYPSMFSPFFYGMSITEASGLCYTRLGLTLLAIGDSKHPGLDINLIAALLPTVQVEEGLVGYFIGNDQKTVEIVSFYCEKCHGKSKRRYICKCQRGMGMVVVNHGAHVEKSLIKPFVLKGESYVNTEYGESISNIPSNLKGHVILCMFGSHDASKIGLHSFISPLRSTKLNQSELKPIVIVCEEDCLKKELPFLVTCPKLYVVFGSPLEEQYLKEAKIHSCSTCVIVTAESSYGIEEEEISDKEAILCTLFLKNELGNSTFIITDLLHESNLRFLDFDDEDEDEDNAVMAEPYACGNALASSLFESVTTVAVNTPGAVSLLYSLIDSTTSIASPSQMIAVSLETSKYSSHQTFGDLYGAMLEEHWICLALYRKLTETSEKRCVVCAPSANIRVLPSDIALVLVRAKSLEIL